MQSSSTLSHDGDGQSRADGLAFATSLVALRPWLQRYARSLANNAEVADDLVQDTLLRAWTAQAQFVVDTNLKAWTFTILRNLFLSARRRDRFHGDYDEVAAERIVATSSNQDSAIDLAKVKTAMAMLPDEQRQALQMVAIAGLTTDEAAERIGAPSGTVKSRVWRARAALKLLLTPQLLGPGSAAETKACGADRPRPSKSNQKNMKSGPILIG